MIRYFLARGDRAGSAVIIEGLDSVSCSNPPPRVQIATLGMATYCSACSRKGYIAPKGPRRPGTGPNGMQWALSGDVNICGCNPTPVFYAERGMSMTFTAEEAATLAAPDAPARGQATQDDDEHLEHYFELVDATTGAPVEGMAYKLSSDGQCLVDNATLARGRTRAFSLKECPNLAFVAWREGDVR